MPDTVGWVMTEIDQELVTVPEEQMVGVEKEVAEVSMQSFDVVEEAEEGVPNMMELPVDMLRKYSVVAVAVGALPMEVGVEAGTDAVDEKRTGDTEARYSVAVVVVEGLHEAVDTGIENAEVLEVEVERNFVDEAELN